MDRELYHHGILGQKWGIRRFQNEDGSLTAEGARRYLSDTAAKARTYAPIIAAMSGRDPVATTAVVDDVANKVEFLMSQNYKKMVDDILDPKNIDVATKVVSKMVSMIGDKVITDIKEQGKEYLINEDREGFNSYLRELGNNMGMIAGYNGHKMYKEYAKENHIKTKFEPFGRLKAASSGATVGEQIGDMYSDILYDRLTKGT